jgi:precorrin-6A/cobalt-precorrin-6A reductase
MRHTLLHSRGPYGYEDELALMFEHRIHALVTKNSGGEYTRAKLDAAAALYLPVVMIDRPPLPSDVTKVETVDEAVGWIANVRRSQDG